MFVLLGVVVPLGSAEKEQAAEKEMTATEKAFKEYADLAVGGVWTTPDDKGGTRDFRSEWILGKTFLLTTATAGDDGSLSIQGIDPATGQWKQWGFDSLGGVGTVVVKRAGPGVWSFREEIRRRGGTLTTNRYTITKLGDDQSRAEAQEVKIDGKEQPLWKMELKREKERPRPAQGANRGDAPKKDMTAGEKAFREWGDYSVGGTWMGTDAQGDKFESRWEWILNKSFLQVTWKITGDSGLSVIGIDPETGKLTGWSFDDKGRVWKIIVNVNKAGEWTETGTGKGKKGSSSWKATTTKLGADRTRIEIKENILDGKKLSPDVVNLTRKK
jgi:hypothetical protein